jgi:hypothetical protein
MRHVPSSPGLRRLPLAIAWLCLAALAGPAQASNTVYRWVDADGVVHLSSTRPPAGVEFEKLTVASTKSAKGNASATRPPPGVSPNAQRTRVLASLRNRECVIALEALDRIARRREPVDPTEFKRLQQTADQNCSQDPARRREQEEMAARLRVANSDVCVQARNELADMLEPGRRPQREQLKAQQEFIEVHCKAPVR